MEKDNYMGLAIELAREALADGEVPVGCVIVRDGTVIGRGRNRREGGCDATAHAEILAIQEACRAVGGWRLSECTLYVTLEPCAMCTGAIVNARIPVVVYGARDRLAGACGGVLNLFEEGFGHHPKLYGGIREQECAQLLAAFFQERRQAAGCTEENI
ncbi:MAG: tRNA adenosine(34) deaminase TadA [Clostridiaceae bacterium]|nr:tRNA adenosine(34) deaminase TadA [Clostridiaceae bacterium]